MSKMKVIIFPTIIIALAFVVFYEVLGLVEPFTRNCWGHAMSKCCQYATYDNKVFVGLMLIPIKECQFILLKTTTWTQKSGKGWQEWKKSCLDIGICPHKLETIINKQLTLELNNQIAYYYAWQQSMAFQRCVPSCKLG